MASIIIHKSGASLWQSISRKRYPYFLHTLFLRTLSLNRYLFIAKSARGAILPFSSQPTRYPFSASPFAVSSFSLIPSFSYLSIRVSSFQLKTVGTDISSVSPSSLIFFPPRPSIISRVLSLISISYSSERFNGDKNKVIICDRSSRVAKLETVLFTATVAGILRQAWNSDVLSVKTWYSSVK